MKSQHHGWQLPANDTLATVPSAITLVRTLVAVAFALVAVTSDSLVWLIAAIATYWVGDIADGLVARLTKRETRSGAIFDIMADRLSVGLIYLIFGFWHPELLWAIGLYLVEFMFIDGFLSLSFLFWPLLSPNYFYLIDKQIFQLNWSLFGKAANSSIFLLITIIFQQPWLSAAVAGVALLVKLYSTVRLYRVVGLPKVRPF
ncbi:MAG TPA: CDP-alcohol phosphatidyltransferase family protein [Candidatus Saccharimonadales bacterium]